MRKRVAIVFAVLLLIFSFVPPLKAQAPDRAAQIRILVDAAVASGAIELPDGVTLADLETTAVLLFGAGDITGADLTATTATLRAFQDRTDAIIAGLQSQIDRLRIQMSVIQKASGQVNNTTNTLTVTLPNPTKSGRAILIAVTSWPDIYNTPTHSGSETVTQAGSDQTTVSNAHVGIFYVRNILGRATHSVTVTGPGATEYLTMHIAEVDDIDTARDPLLTSAGNSAQASTTNPVSPSITTSEQAFYFSACGGDTNSNLTAAGNGFAVQDNNQNTGGQPLWVVSKIGPKQTTSASYTLDAASAYGCVIAAFRMAEPLTWLQEPPRIPQPSLSARVESSALARNPVSAAPASPTLASWSPNEVRPAQPQEYALPAIVAPDKTPAAVAPATPTVAAWQPNEVRPGVELTYALPSITAPDKTPVAAAPASTLASWQPNEARPGVELTYALPSITAPDKTPVASAPASTLPSWLAADVRPGLPQTYEKPSIVAPDKTLPTAAPAAPTLASWSPNEVRPAQPQEYALSAIVAPDKTPAAVAPATPTIASWTPNEGLRAVPPTFQRAGAIAPEKVLPFAELITLDKWNPPMAAALYRGFFSQGGVAAPDKVLPFIETITLDKWNPAMPAPTYLGIYRAISGATAPDKVIPFVPGSVQAMCAMGAKIRLQALALAAAQRNAIASFGFGPRLAIKTQGARVILC